MKQRFGENIDSHSSFNNNLRLQGLLIKIDATGEMSSNTCHLSHIVQYYNANEQLYINIRDVLSNQEEIDKLRVFYHKTLGLIETDSRCRTKKALRLLLQVCKEFNFQLISGLQSMKYFFRTSRAQVKGLKNVSSLIDESIFGGKKSVEADENSDESEL